MRLFLDANVLFSATASPDGVASSLLTLAGSGVCELVTSWFATVETGRNLRAKVPAAIGRWNRVRRVIAVVPEADPRIAVRSGASLPEKDRPVLAAAVACGAHVLATGDRRHFGALIGRAVGGTLVLAPREALAWLLSGLEPKRYAEAWPSSPRRTLPSQPAGTAKQRIPSPPEASWKRTERSDPS